MMKFTAVQINPPKLHKTIVAHFGLDEIRDLCLDLSLDFDELPPAGRSRRKLWTTAVISPNIFLYEH